MKATRLSDLDILGTWYCHRPRKWCCMILIFFSNKIIRIINHKSYRVIPSISMGFLSSAYSAILILVHLTVCPCSHSPTVRHLAKHYAACKAWCKFTAQNRLAVCYTQSHQKSVQLFTIYIYILVGISLHAECGCFVGSLELKAMALEAVKDSGQRLPKMPRGLEDLGKNNSQGQQDCWHLAPAVHVQAVLRLQHATATVNAAMPMNTQHYLQRIMAWLCINFAQQHEYPVVSTWFSLILHDYKSDLAWAHGHTGAKFARTKQVALAKRFRLSWFHVELWPPASRRRIQHSDLVELLAGLTQKICGPGIAWYYTIRIHSDWVSNTLGPSRWGICLRSRQRPKEA